MSTCYIPCHFCGDEIGSAHEMVVLREDADCNITCAAHPECKLQEEERIREQEMLWGR